MPIPTPMTVPSTIERASPTPSLPSVISKLS